MDFSVVTGLIGIAAFILAIPMSIAANLFTPKLRNWWALTSLERRENRIAKLEIEVKTLTVSLDVDVRYEQVVVGLRHLAVAGILSLYIFGFVILEAWDLLGTTTIRPSAGLIQINHVITGLLVYACGLVLAKAIARFRRASKVSVAKRLVNTEMELKRLMRKTFPSQVT